MYVCTRYVYLYTQWGWIYNLQADDILGEEILDMPGTVGEFRRFSISSVMWKTALTKIKEKRLSNMMDDPELEQTLSGALNCKS